MNMKINAKPEQVEDLPKNSFLRTLAELRKGGAVTDASNDLAAVVKAVRKTGRPGELTIKLKVRAHADGETITIEDSIAPKAPRKATKATSFFDGEDGVLSRENPDQPEMFTSIEGGKGEEIATTSTPAAAVNA